MSLALLRFAALGAAVLTASAPTLAAERKIPGLTYQEPAGEWEAKVSAEGVAHQRMLMNRDQRAGALILVATQKLGGSSQADFDKAFEALEDGVAIMRNTKRLTQRSGVATNGLPMRWSLKCCGMDEDISA